jgi:PII-like signaling protein
MKITGKGKILKIYIGETDKWNHQPLYHAIIKKLKKEGIAGATVLKGIEGFGLNSHIKSAHILQLSEDLPLIIEVVDKAEKIEKIIPDIKEMVDEGLITIEDVEVIKHTSSNSNT